MAKEKLHLDIKVVKDEFAVEIKIPMPRVKNIREFVDWLKVTTEYFEAKVPGYAAIEDITHDCGEIVIGFEDPIAM